MKKRTLKNKYRGLKAVHQALQEVYDETAQNYDEALDLVEQYADELDKINAKGLEIYKDACRLSCTTMGQAKDIASLKAQVEALTAELRLATSRETAWQKQAESYRNSLQAIPGGLSAAQWKDRHDDEQKRRVHYMNETSRLLDLVKVATHKIEELNEELKDRNGGLEELARDNKWLADEVEYWRLFADLCDVEYMDDDELDEKDKRATELKKNGHGITEAELQARLTQDWQESLARSREEADKAELG